MTDSSLAAVVKQILGPRVTVVWMAVIDVLLAINSVAVLWHYFIEHFTDITVLPSGCWNLNLLPLLSTLTAIPVQIFLANRIRRFSKAPGHSRQCEKPERDGWTQKRAPIGEKRGSMLLGQNLGHFRLSEAKMGQKYHVFEARKVADLRPILSGFWGHTLAIQTLIVRIGIRETENVCSVNSVDLKVIRQRPRQLYGQDLSIEISHTREIHTDVEWPANAKVDVEPTQNARGFVDLMGDGRESQKGEDQPA
ncbi:hypothetical protein CPB85DRAFT_1253568 [Mucidula mucida]|nr:hypothetical protein CPB85DRAFT_1253568 [Mucidula mucida]